jgi:hypothetical protein
MELFTDTDDVIHVAPKLDNATAISLVPPNMLFDNLGWVDQ